MSLPPTDIVGYITTTLAETVKDVQQRTRVLEITVTEINAKMTIVWAVLAFMATGFGSLAFWWIQTRGGKP